jgi:transcription initiation factor TFIIB
MAIEHRLGDSGPGGVVLEHEKPVLSTALMGYVRRFCAKLYASDEVEWKAAEIIWRSSGEMFRNKEPRGVSAAAVYIASNSLGRRITQREVAKIAGVTEATIRNRYKELVRILNRK